MMNPSRFAALLFVSCAAAAAHAQPLPGEPDPKQVEALCARYADAAPPPGDEPTEAQLRHLDGCDSEALLYGIGRRADPVQARLCAFAEEAHRQPLHERPLFGGAMMLATIYANGLGVPRNRDLAVSYACRSDDSPAARESRVLHVADLLHESWYKPIFSPCDDATSGEAGGQCAAHDARFKAVSFRTALEADRAALPVAARGAFDALRAAQKQWSDLRSENETDLTGTLRNAFITNEQQLQDADFTAMLDRLRRAAPPKLGAVQRGAAQARIDAVLRSLPADDVATLGTSTIRAGGIRAAQSAWIAYRDAWGRFADAAYPRWGASGAEAWVSIKRADMLEHLMAYR